MTINIIISIIIITVIVIIIVMVVIIVVIFIVTDMIVITITSLKCKSNEIHNRTHQCHDQDGNDGDTVDGDDNDDGDYDDAEVDDMMTIVDVVLIMINAVVVVCLIPSACCSEPMAGLQGCGPQLAPLCLYIPPPPGRHRPQPRQGVGVEQACVWAGKPLGL